MNVPNSHSANMMWHDNAGKWGVSKPAGNCSCWMQKVFFDEWHVQVMRFELCIHPALTVDASFLFSYSSPAFLLLFSCSIFLASDPNKADYTFSDWEQSRYDQVFM